MRSALFFGLGLMLLAGCGLTSPVRTSSDVRMTGNVTGRMDADVKMKGQVEGKVRTEMASVIDNGPILEVPIAPCMLAPDQPRVAVIDVDGVLTNLNHVGPFSVGENPVAMFKEKLDACASNPNVKAVVLRINTPGGGVAATDLMWHELTQFRKTTGKPVVAALLDVGAGGGYFLATGCDAIFALPSSVVGGIGVMLNVYFARMGMEMINVFDDSIRVGEKIDMGSPVRKVSKEEQTLFKSMALGYHTRFKEVVLQARPGVKPDADLFDGRVMSGPQAVEAKLVDALGYLDDAVTMAFKMAKQDQPGPIAAVMYRRAGDAARTVYASTPNRPIHTTAMPMSVPGPDRSRLPLFLYMWQAEPTLLKVSGM